MALMHWHWHSVAFLDVYALALASMHSMALMHLCIWHWHWHEMAFMHRHLALGIGIHAFLSTHAMAFGIRQCQWHSSAFTRWCLACALALAILCIHAFPASMQSLAASPVADFTHTLIATLCALFIRASEQNQAPHQLQCAL
eukprot:1161070-Pelagomonas_calceolata.AAC.1